MFNKWCVRDGPAMFNRRNKINKDAIRMKCAICKNCLVKVKYTGNTMNMHSHLQRHHPDLLIEKVAYVNSANLPARVNAIFKARLPFLSPGVASIMKSVIWFICKDLSPYSMVRNEGLCQMPPTLEPRYDIPSWKYFTGKAITALYDETTGRVKDALHSAESIVLTCYEWAMESYTTICVFRDKVRVLGQSMMASTYTILPTVFTHPSK